MLEGSILKIQRWKLAEEVIRWIDTVTLCTPEEVVDIHKRAQQGEFDTLFDDEKK